MLIIKKISNFLAILSGLLIFVGALLITYSAFARFLFHTSSTWEGELAIYCLMAGVWFGCGPTMLADRHVSIRLISPRASPTVANILHVFACLVSAIVGVIYTYQGVVLTLKAWHGGWRSSTLWAPKIAIPYSLVPIGLGLFVVAALIRLFFREQLQSSEYGTEEVVDR